MGFDPPDQEVIRHLRTLKQADKEYPPELLAARRQRFLRQMGQMSLGIGAGVIAQQVVKSAKAPPTPPVVSTLLETILVVAIIAEAGAVTYFYRDKLAKLLKTFVASAEIQEIISPLIITTSQVPAAATPSSGMTSTLVSPTMLENPAEIVVTFTSTGTPNPALVEGTPPVLQTTLQVNSTPVLNGNNGNHYGQTPKPERTKENNGNDDKPPKKDPPPKDDSKPPKKK